MKPKNLPIYIQEGATFRKRLQFNFNCLDKTVVAQLWTRNRKTKLADFTIDWINRDDGLFDLVLPYPITDNLDQEALWELMVIENLSQERQYYLVGNADWVPNSTSP